MSTSWFKFGQNFLRFFEQFDQLNVTISVMENQVKTCFKFLDFQTTWTTRSIIHGSRLVHWPLPKNQIYLKTFQFVWTKGKKLCYLVYQSNKPLLHEKKRLPFGYGEIFELTLPFYSFDNKWAIDWLTIMDYNCSNTMWKFSNHSSIRMMW